MKAGLIRGMISLDGGGGGGGGGDNSVVFDCLCTFESWPDLSRWGGGGGDNSVVFDCLCTFESWPDKRDDLSRWGTIQ